MTMTAADNFKRYCSQLEKYGQTESVHSPVMALLRRKARKQLIELMKTDNDCTSSINKLWIVGYYHPFQFYAREDNSDMDTITLLTMFCGELQEMLMLTEQIYASIWNLYIADLHRYMSDDEIQKSLAVGYYTRTIELDPSCGRAFHMLALVQPNLLVAQKVRLLMLAQLAENPVKKRLDVSEFVKSSESDSNSSDQLLEDFANWALNENQKRVDHQLNGLKMINQFESDFKESPISNWSMTMSGCRYVAQLANKNLGFNQFIDCFDVITSFYLEIYSYPSPTMSLCAEIISWICDAKEIFDVNDPVKKEPYFQSLSVFAKTKWNELNDLAIEQINTVFGSGSLSEGVNSIRYLIFGPESEPSLEELSLLVKNYIRLNQSTVELRSEKGDDSRLLKRINRSETKRLDIPLEVLAEKVSQMNREDWRPVYVIMDYDTILNKSRNARKVWSIDDFICILPSSVLEQLDSQKMKIKSVRPVIRTLMELQAEGRIILKACENERRCAEELVQSVKGTANDHKHIVAFLCKCPEEENPIEGVTFYDIDKFYTKYLNS
ncbi:Protein CBR-SMG-5 [Caenorhabditis briggsae]|uniref:PIN domain-containing protein n=2 Tax=Caenorhabditis briggsae TaxID=6238 RepID=A0AAE9E2M5_CAEBR|nr:Protein CBR-SMG-5 [Caenorhabditis briggsae]ULU10473.1 hypothetical protein L3Y34_014633 [Caenorhabditis briggsae]UMM11402.1 hypothetical protein L5515_000709 [Caenorhabditis briggsae]CAP24838.1 Protein CBR-SMG-5 [Caenorhabditis briggsae]